MVASELFPGVYLIKNFLSDSDLKFFKEVRDSASEEDWFHEGEPPQWQGRVLKLSMDQRAGVVSDLYSRTLDMFTPRDEKTITDFADINRILVGTKLEKHVDDGKKGAEIKYGGVIYLNEDYEGGEIAYYENIDSESVVFSYKPKSGDMVVHLASMPHGVLPVTTGTRYMLTFFVMGTDCIFIG